MASWMTAEWIGFWWPYYAAKGQTLTNPGEDAFCAPPTLALPRKGGGNTISGGMTSKSSALAGEDLGGG